MSEKEKETVVFGPPKPPTSDWRWQEVLNMEPHLVMAELQELDENLFAARSELREAVRELAAREDTLHVSKQQALEDVRGDVDLADLATKLFKGGTKGERAERQETYLAGIDWVSESMREIEVASIRKDNAQVAFDSLLDRQTNLGRFANMYAATARLLASIRPPEEAVEDVELAEAVVGLRSLYAHIIDIFASQPTKDVHPAFSSVYDEAREWMLWSKNAVGQPPVDTAVLVTKIMQVCKPMQAPPDLEPGHRTRPVSEHEVRAAMETARVESREVAAEATEGEVLASLGLSPDPAEAIRPHLRPGAPGQVEISDTSVQTGVKIGLVLNDDEEWPRVRLFFIGKGKDPYSVVCEDAVESVAQRRIAAELGYTEVDKATYLEHRDVWLKEIAAEAEAVVLPQDGRVLTNLGDAMEAAGAEMPVQPPEHAQERCAVEIPASMELSPDEAEAAAAAIKRHRGEESDEDYDKALADHIGSEVGPDQPDEDISL